MKNLFYKSIILLSSFIFFFLYSCEDPANSLYKEITFQQKTTMPGIGRASAVAFSINGKGYVALGRKDRQYDVLSDCWEYDPQNEIWTEKKPFPGKARVRATAAVVNGIAYVGLGFDPLKGLFNDSAYLNDWWSYDPQADKWTKLLEYPSKARISCISYVLNGIIYIGAGYDGLSFTNELWSYNPNSNSWKKLNNISDKARSGAVACTDGEKVFFGTGFMIKDISDWWQYTPETDTWKKRKSMPDNGRENGIALSVNNRFFVGTGRNFGGDLTGGNIKSDILEYNPDNNSWHKRGNIPDGKRENAISFVIDGKAYVGFGENDSTVINDLWCFEP